MHNVIMLSHCNVGSTRLNINNATDCSMFVLLSTRKLVRQRRPDIQDTVVAQYHIQILPEFHASFYKTTKQISSQKTTVSILFPGSFCLVITCKPVVIGWSARTASCSCLCVTYLLCMCVSVLVY